MEFIRRNISEVLADLPAICAAHLPSDNSPILIKRGTRGYCQRWEAYDGERFNKHNGITDAQVGAMLAGSIAPAPIRLTTRTKPGEPPGSGWFRGPGLAAPFRSLDRPSAQASRNTLVVLDGDDTLVLLVFPSRYDVVV